MTKEEAIRQACEIVALAYHSIDDFREASDGFCDECRTNQDGTNRDDANYRNDGKALEYVRRAVLDRLKSDGYKIAHGFDPETGKEARTLVADAFKALLGGSV